MRPEDLDLLQRRCADAGTRTRNATGALGTFWKDGPAARYLIGYEAERLLTRLLESAESLARLLPVANPEYEAGADFETLTAALEEVRLALRARQGSDRRARLAEKLADTRGRTPEEAASYEAAARRMLQS